MRTAVRGKNEDYGSQNAKSGEAQLAKVGAILHQACSSRIMVKFFKKPRGRFFKKKYGTAATSIFRVASTFFKFWDGNPLDEAKNYSAVTRSRALAR